MNEKALDAFMVQLNASMANLVILTKYVDNHMGRNPDTLNWGDVGDATRLADTLEDLAGEAVGDGAKWEA